jgi:V8-like Glu-specific endopeptidase
MRTWLRQHRARLSAAAITGALTATAGLAAAGGTAGASTIGAAGGPPATQAVVHQVASPAQAAARGFWTAARMASATPARPEGAASTPAPPPGIPNPTYFNGVPTVGALFFTTGTRAHFCTASVVDSATSDLVLTAAHCVYGNGGYATNIAYVPKWHQGVSPYGMWAVRSITVTAGWPQSQDPDLDFAFLAVSPPPGTGRPIQSVTGGLRLGVGTGYAHPVTVIGYNDTDNQPIECATDSFEFKPTQLEFSCNSFWGGTSGGPWILHLNPVTGSGTVIGDIGGYEQGGDYPWASYSPYYASPILRLFRQAQLQRP